MNTKKCSRCRTEKTADQFNFHRGNKDGLDTYCRECAALLQREKYLKNPDRIKSIVKTWCNKNKDKTRAHASVHQAIKLGKMIKPEECAICHCKNSVLCAHHWRGYEKKHRFDVQWLCRGCHNRLTRIQKEGNL